MKRLASLVGKVYFWKDTGLYSVKISGVAIGNEVKLVSFESGIETNARKAFEIVFRKVLKWSKGRYFFVNASFKNLEKIIIRNDKLSESQQAMHGYRVSGNEWQAKRKYRNGAAIVCSGKKYEREEVKDGTTLHLGNCGGPKDNRFWLDDNNPVKWNGNYKAPDAYKWSPENNDLLEKIMR